jgi:hypothetical protein
MKIYFCGAILGGRQNAGIYAVIVDHLEAAGHDVLTKHVARPDVLASESGVTARQVYERDMAWLAECEAVVAEVTTPSLGVGYELATALRLGKPTLCLFRQGAAVTKMITGNTSPSLTVTAYSNPVELLTIVDAFLSELTGQP